METSGGKRLEGLSEKIFLDRYALKNADTSKASVGDIVLVLTKDDPRFPVKEVGEVIAREGNEVTVRLRRGELVKSSVEKLSLTIEKTPEEMWDRLADAMASVEVEPDKQMEWQERFRYILDDWKLVPGGRIAAGAGANEELTLFNCYVIPSPKDSRGGIMKTLTEMTEIMARGGGVGINLSSLRPRRAIVAGVNGSSSGAVSWGGLFSYTTGLIEQGGCFGPQERIATDKGLLKAEELADRMDAGESFQAFTHQGLRPITYSFRNGTKSVFRVKTAKGFQIDVTKDHKMGVLQDGVVKTVPLRELNIGSNTLLLVTEQQMNQPYAKLTNLQYDRSIMSTTLNEQVKFPIELEERLAYFLGYFYGDGYVHWDRKVTWEAPKAVKLATANDRPLIRERLVEYIHELFGLEATLVKGDGACTNVCVYSRLLVEWLSLNGILKQKSGEIRVPEIIFQSPSSVTAAFISGYFDADGSDRGSKGGYGFDSISEPMLQDVQMLLAANGILSHIIKTDRSSSGWQNIFRLAVTGTEFKQRMNMFMVMSLKKRSVEGKRNHGNGYPRELWSRLGVPGRYYTGVWDSTKANISFRALSRIKERLLLDGQTALAVRVEELLQTVPDTIVSIEPIGIMNVYDFEVQDVHMLSGNGLYTSNSRRGALMLMINDWHPDVLEFITVKQTMGQVTNANLSVCVSNAFMRAVKEDLDWELVFPDTKDADYNELWTGDIDEWRHLGKKVIPYKTVRARDVWHTIIESAWKSAEPGVVFLEYYNQMSNSWYFNPIISTNPCFHPDTRISTEFGLIRIEDLFKQAGYKSFNIVTDNRLVQQAHVVGGRSYEVAGTNIRSATVFPTGLKQTVKISLGNGMDLKVTPEHQIYTVEGWKEAQQLTQEDIVYIQSGKGQFVDKDHLGKQWGMFLGWLTGDGWLSKRGDIGMVFGQEDEEVIPLMIEAGKKFSGAKAKLFKRDNGASQLFWWGKAFREQLMKFGVKAVPSSEKEVPECIFTASKETVVAYLQALFSADGTVYDKDEMFRSVRLTSSSKKLLQDVQLLLLNFGIHGHIYSRNKQNQKLFAYTTTTGEQRTYEGKPFFELVLSGNNIAVFKEEIGFKFISRKQTALERISRQSRKNEKFAAKVISVTAAELVQVYDITESVTNSLIANGMVVHNCGEQGLPGWGVCNLSAVNLSKFYDEEKHDVAWDELAKVTRWSVRFLDNVIDKTPYHFEENERNQKLERRIGLGTMGLAELMIKLGVRYGSAESLGFLDKLYGFMARESYLASTEIAAEKGSFQAFDAEKYVQSGFMKHIIAEFPEIGDAIAENGIRNVTVITQAPTGSTGTMVGTSTGIEPYFAFEYYRQSRLGFDKQYVPIAAMWKDAHPEEELPDYFVTSMSLSAEDHIRVQAAIQRWVDSSISKTANCPADFTVEETGRLYELAFELGCKGVTIYRDGSRDVQVLSTKKDEKAEDDIVQNTVETSIDGPSPDVGSDEYFNVGLAEAAVPAVQTELVLDKQYKRRPQVLRGATYKVNTPFGMAYITINDLNGTPGEIFLNVGKAGSDVFAMAEALGRVCSLFLRYGDHGNKVKLLIKHLKGIGGSGAIGFGVNRVESIADAVAKSLEIHTESGVEQAAAVEPRVHDAITARSNQSYDTHHHVEITSRDLCPSCGSATLINSEGCKQCSNCGYSKCN